MTDDADVDALFWLQLGLCWCRQLQPTQTILVHLQGWANRVTTAHRINTHSYHNHVCLRVICGYVYDVRFMQIFNRGLFPPHIWCLYGPHILKNSTYN